RDAHGRLQTSRRDDGRRGHRPPRRQNMSSNAHHQQLLERIKARKANVGVIGLGYVGLPLAVEFARQGFNVYGFDVDESKTGQINAGKSYIPDVAEKELAEVVKAGNLRGTTKMFE